MDMGSLDSRAGVGAVTPATRTNEAGTAAARQPMAETQKNESRTEPEREQVLAAVEEMQEFVAAARHNIQFQLDEDSGRMLVKVTERDSGEVIRQIPSEEAVRLAENLSQIRSLLFSAEA